MPADYLAAGPAIIARIGARVPALASVRQATGRAAVDESVLAAPAALVIYDGDRLGDEAGQGQAQIVHQRWLVVLAVRHAAQGDGGAASAALAGPLLSALLAALQGWAPTPAHRSLIRTDAPRPGHSPGFVYYPLAFESAVSTLGS
jgi:hypothetical protein